MCGIAGLSLREGAAPDARALAALSSALAHRGPDGHGQIVAGTGALVHRRLSIIDPVGGAQPFADADEAVFLVANGEIYNYKALRAQLVREGARFATRSDNEVALHLYLRHGLDFVHHLQGMYAIAILDTRTRDVILARDPVGIKPLYIAERSMPGIAFASEPAALLAAGWLSPAVDQAVLPEYLNRQFSAGRRTLLAGIERVLPGEVMRLRDGRIAERRRQTLSLKPAIAIGEDDALARLDALLLETTGSHLQSDVPYGAFLSGGIDSSSIVTCMARIDDCVNSFTLGFDDASVDDERASAARLADRLPITHQGLLFSEDDFWTTLPVLARIMDDLVADYAALPTIKLARCAAETVKVILSGEGGDEAFAGYGRYRRGGFVDRLRGRRFRGRGDAAYFPELFRRDGHTDWRKGWPVEPLAAPDWTRIQRYQATDIADWLPHDLLTKLDRCLMAFGIEGRVPFLDRAMLEFAFALPDDLKVRGRDGKYLLKRWLSGRHPVLDVWGRKRGFTVPIRDWQERRRADLANYLVDHDGLMTFVDRTALRRWLERPLTNRAAVLLFRLVVFALWHDWHIEGRAPTGGRFPIPATVEANA